MKKIGTFFSRVFCGEDVVLVKQGRDQWNAQFSAGKWSRLQEGQANTVEISRRILDVAQTKNERIRVLDIGCGNGGLAKLIAGRSGIEYVGIDISDAAITAARAIVPEGKFLCIDAEYPPSDLGVYEVIVCNEVLYYMNLDRVLPRYRVHAAEHAAIYISVIRTWRTPFLFRRIKRCVHIGNRFRVTDDSHTWDVALGCFI